MKRLLTLVGLIAFSFAVQAQKEINPNKDYNQKRFLDSLQKTFGQSSIQVNPQPLWTHKTPVIRLQNEGEKVGMSGEDTVYKMKKDNMPLLKPNTNTTCIPNAAEGKMFMVPPPTKKKP